MTRYLAVVEPVPGAACADDALQLVALHPDQLVDALIAPQRETLPTQLHGSVEINIKHEYDTVSMVRCIIPHCHRQTKRFSKRLTVQNILDY